MEVKNRKLISRFVYLLCLLVFFIWTIPEANGQQGNVWYFGEKAGLSFNTNPPTPLTDGQLNSFEGCASICDSSGELLFYTDGVTVWNKQHQVMTNGTGLKGSFSSSNSALVIPKPGSSMIYYIFNAAAIEANNEGYFYSEVDMSLQGGLGAVTVNKNILLYSRSTEKLTAVRHSNGIDVWVITRPLGSGEWKVFKVDCNGVNTTPVSSNTGYVGAISDEFTAGCLKSSPDGTKIAAVNSFAETWELLEFDALTGRLSNGLVFPESPIPYGVEFSPNSKLIYIGEFSVVPDIPRGGVIQFDLSNYDSTSIAASRTLIGISASDFDFVGALQLGPDNKIYCALANAQFLSVINTPDLQGMACAFTDRQVQLASNTESGIGLPGLFKSLNKNVDFDYTKSQDCATINFSGNANITGNVNWLWDFGDGTTGTGQNISHTYSSGTAVTDTVTLTVIPVGSCGSYAISKKISFDFRKPIANFGYETKCENFEVGFFDSSSVSVPIQAWSWDFGNGNVSATQNPLNTYTAPGTYTVKLSVQSSNGCISDTISKTVMVEALPEVSFTNTRACIGEQIQFANTSGIPQGTITSFTWNFGDGSVSAIPNPVHIYNRTGDYTTTLKVVTANGCTATASRIFHIESVHAFAGNDTVVSIGQPVQLHASGGQVYQWSPPDFLNIVNISGPIAVLNRDQTYNVKVTTQEGCTGFDDITIKVLKGPEIYVPSGFAPEGKNRIFRPVLAGIEELYYFSVYNRWGQLVFTTKEPGKGWDGKINGITQPTGVFVWVLKAKDYQQRIINRKGTVVLIR
jgi:PKD repeat protein